MHLVGYLYEDYHNVRSLEHKVRKTKVYWKITTKLINITLKWTKRKMLNSYSFPSDKCWPGADPGFVGPESYTVFGAVFKKKTTEFRIQN
jgi:hypothetical protein